MHFITILGFDRSGTTFLGNFVSQFCKKAIYVGEIDKGLEKYFSGSKEMCSCGKLYEDCEVWGKVLPHLKNKLDVKTLLEKIKEITGAEVLIDSSKKKKYIKIFSTLFHQNYSLFHIVRDPHGIALSRTKNREKRLKKGTHPKPVIAKQTNLMMYFDSLQWSVDNVWMENFKKGFQHKDLIYETLNDSTATEIEEFLKMNNVEIGPNQIENHVLWGCGNTRMKNNSKIEINMSWRSELTTIQMNIINILSFPVRKIFNYDFQAKELKSKP